ncbi:MAG: hypothetical protein J6X55_16740 [Victivallales bacterium]|nr:hypothetical protein [Victivallales bacterium]
MDLKEAKELVGNRQLWPRVRDYLAAGGEMKDFTKPENRLGLLDKETLDKVHLWLDALAHANEWKTIVDGAKVRELKANYPGIYPDVFRYLPYFSKFDLHDSSNLELVMFLLKIKFPEAYQLCCS